MSLLLVSQFRSKRFAEYFPPFAILFAAFSWQAFQTLNVVKLPDEFKRDIEPYLDSEKQNKWGDLVKSFNLAVKWVIGIFLIFMVFYNFKGFDWKYLKQEGMMTSIKNNDPNSKYAEGMSWIKENVPPGERIFNSNWDDFPKMFFHDTTHNYVYGLDPNYLYSKNPDLYKTLTDITGGKIEDPAPVIRDKFGAKYVFNDAKENTDFIAKALDSGWCDKVYADDEVIILRIRDEKGVTPEENDDAESQLTDEEKKQLDEEMKQEEKNSNTANTNEEEEVEP